jgi:hypothetical protein
MMLSYTENQSDRCISIPMLQHIPLGSAYLCQDCNSIGNCSRQCPACASEVLLGLAAVLNREVEPVAQVVEEPEYSYRPALVA